MFLDALVDPFDLPAGLWLVGPGVDERDATGVEQDFERDGHLEPCEVRAQAAMRPGTEGQVTVRPAIEDHLVRSIELVRVVGGEHAHRQDAISLAHVDTGELIRELTLDPSRDY